MVFADSQKEDDTVSHYKHLSIAERESLYLGVNQGKSIRTIARELMLMYGKEASNRKQ